MQIVKLEEATRNQVCVDEFLPVCIVETRGVVDDNHNVS